jgi:hypothetical protein
MISTETPVLGRAIAGGFHGLFRPESAERADD